MKSYSEANGKQPFDWNAFLNKESYTHEELQDARERSSLWVTCACGNQCDILPRDADGGPEDADLHALGISFYEHIQGAWNSKVGLYYEYDPISYIEKAKETLRKIEARSAFLIAEIQKQKP